MKYLIIVDMQNDFITGSLPAYKGLDTVPFVIKLVEWADENNIHTIFTLDTHDENYLDTTEGKNLPITHCVKNTFGWQIHNNIHTITNAKLVEKNTFGTLRWTEIFGNDIPETIILCGVCTDICVITNALILKTMYPDARIIVAREATAGTTRENENAALDVMRACQIEVIDRVVEIINSDL